MESLRKIIPYIVISICLVMNSIGSAKTIGDMIYFPDFNTLFSGGKEMTQTYKVQVSMNQAHIVESGFAWKQGDFGFNLEIEVLDFDTTGVTPQIIFRKSAGAVESTSVTQSSNKFTYTIRGTELDTPGPGICDLKLKNSTTQRISTASFKFFVIPDTMDGLNERASSYSDTIEQIIDGYEEELTTVENDNTDIKSSLSFDESNTQGIMVNKTVRVSNQMYQVIDVLTDITLDKDKYYHIACNFASTMNVGGYLKLKNSGGDIITNSESFNGKSYVEFVYKPTSNSNGNKLTIEFNGSGTYQANIIMYSVWDGSINKIQRCFSSVTFDKNDMRNGTANNPGNSYYVSLPAIKTKGNTIFIITDRPNTANCVYRYQINPMSKEIDDIASDNSARIAEYVTLDNPFYYFHDNSVGVQIAITEYNTQTNSNIALRISDFLNYHVTIFDATSYYNTKTLRNTKELLSAVKLDQTYLRNGTATNPYNSNCVAVPVIKTKAKKIMVRTDRPNTAGHVYRFVYITVLSDIDDVGTQGSASDYSDFYETNDNIYELTNENRRGVQFGICEYNTSTSSYKALRVSDFNNYNIYVYDISAIPNLIDGLPAYYDNYIKARMNTIWSRDVDVAGKGDSFVFFTDCHDENNYYSPKIAKYITDNSAVSMIIVGGDMINQPASKEAAIEGLTNHARLCRVTDDVVFLRGNHDTNPYGTGQLTSDEYYSIFNTHIEKYVDTKGKNYYYRDNTSQKIRYIFLDTGEDGSIDSTQSTWVHNVASELSSEWTIVLMAHWVVYYEDYTQPEPTTPIADLVASLSDINAVIACIIGGHSHIDIIDTTTYSFPIIVTTCDSNGNQQIPGTPSVDRSGKTINEQALTVFHINTNTKTIYMTRVGGGEINVLSTGDYTDNDKVLTYGE